MLETVYKRLLNLRNLSPIAGKKFFKVGCILVKDNRIISQGYNGFLPGAAHNSIIRNNHEQATVHAEQNAIADCAKRTVSCLDCIAYITHYPCIKNLKVYIKSIKISEVF